MMIDYQKLARIIIRVKLRTASVEDRIILNCWLEEDKANHQIYKDIIRGKLIRGRLELEDKAKGVDEMNAVRKKIADLYVAKRRVRKRRIVGSAAFAASMIGVAFFFFSRKEVVVDPTLVPSVVKEKSLVAMQQPGAVLILPDGKQVELCRAGKDSINLILNSFAENEISSFRDQKDTSLCREEWSRIVIPRGGNYSFTLSDGSRVWMNAESVLEVPTNFMESERVVRLEGEAYFEVKPDSGRPFIVETGEIQTRVLGTSFNVRAYGDENAIYTTLIKGKVEVSLKDDHAGKLVLEPEIQSVWKRGSEYIVSRWVDINMVMAWREGIFKFKETDLDVILKVLSRWYDVEFIYNNKELKKHTFNGYISKYETLASILETFTMAGGPEFNVKDQHTVEVLERR